MTETSHHNERLSKAAGIAGIGAFITAACCALPIMLMAAGVSGAIVAMVSKATVLAVPLIGLSVVLLGLGWMQGIKAKAPRRVRMWLIAGTVLVGLAALIVINETVIIDTLLEYM